MCRKEKEKQMQALVDQWQQSDYNQREFAALHQINYHKFRYWISKLNKTQTQDSFVELQPATPPTAQICLRYPNGVELYLPASTPATVIQGLIHL